MDDVLDALRAGLPLVFFLLLLQARAPHAHRMRTASAPHAHRMRTACAPHVHRMRTASAPHAHRMCTVCAAHVHRVRAHRMHARFLLLLKAY